MMPHRYIHIYNKPFPQSELRTKTPLQEMKDWNTLKPDLFKKNSYYLTPYNRPSTSR